ncbi:hypothetical protein PQ469_24300 [Mucilaginibacter sp. KACC 22773]|uniref:hypothetical protein n=1 Tax=Mucilaginibacter sp. KACC 22773 TaxID=3025671 RepID=UPI0023657197|nr:hypothetical protein [Mucilaginibacter sp. KACC 22773]WDF77009.1 hypothetical protein PQ469_24300 [Mucilaginibacter sp. KACC 22773]
MPKRISTLLGLTKIQLKNKGVFDSMTDFDSRLHIDPALIAGCTIPEFKDAATKLGNYFTDILHLVQSSRKIGDPFWREAHRRLTFGEGLNTGLGYSQKGTRGSGIGPEMAERILTTVHLVVRAGISDPKLFDLVPVIEENIGADRISDMVSIILKDEFHAYTTRIATELNVQPLKDSQGKTVVFVPNVLLSDLAVSAQWEDVAIAAEHNAGVRKSMNDLIGTTWKRVVSDFKKEDLKKMLLDNPKLLMEFLERYKNRTARGYDFLIDHLGVTIWDVLGPETAVDNPLDLTQYASKTKDQVLEIVTAIAEKFKKLTEHNGLVYNLYDEKGKLRPERFPQLLFYAIADSYAESNGLDLNREINAGSGALDFKLSHGAAKVNLEIKYTSNPKLIEGFTKQLPTYNVAEGVNPNHSIYLVIRVNDKQDEKIREIQAIIAERKRLKLATPVMIVVNAIIKPSASKR